MSATLHNQKISASIRNIHPSIHPINQPTTFVSIREHVQEKMQVAFKPSQSCQKTPRIYNAPCGNEGELERGST